jgi:hypothetical protein
MIVISNQNFLGSFLERYRSLIKISGYPGLKPKYEDQRFIHDDVHRVCENDD